MVTEVEIANSALTKVGADVISSLNQNVRQAKILKRIFYLVRDDVLRAHPWNFAIKRATIYPNGSTPGFGYDYEYDLPNDCLRVLDTDPEYAKFVIEGRKLLTNYEEIGIRYIYRNEDPSSWDACFAEAFAWRLARELSYALAQSSALTELCTKGYQAALSEARSIDGAEGVLEGLIADEWILARR